jgi:histidine phosphotransferase ChpT
VLLNLVLMAGDALVRGGRLDVGAEVKGGTTEIVVRAEGDRLVLDAELRTALNGEASEDSLTPRAAAAWLVHLLAVESGGHSQVLEPEPTVLLFGATLKRA